MSFSVLCTGSSGLVASDFKHLCFKQSVPFYGLDLHGESESTDITNISDLKTIIEKYTDKIRQGGKQPILFHFAAITLTGQNLTQDQINLSQLINISGTKNILDVCGELHIPVVHISTDFVFSGASKAEPYLPSDDIKPDNTVYSQTKAEAEKLVQAASNKQLVAIVRLAFPYGNFSHPKPCLVRKMLAWMDSKPEVGLYSDQHICPTPISYFSQACLTIAQLINNNNIQSGTIWHCVGKAITPFEFGNIIKAVFSKEANIQATTVVGKGVTNLVLDSLQTEQLLKIQAPSHEKALKQLALPTR